ncbi:hypothetical protein MKX03_012989, partial [Papaver bracteatum]
MSILCSPFPSFLPRYQFPAHHRPPVLTIDTFIGNVYGFIYRKLGVDSQYVDWPTVQDPLAIYRRVVLQHQTVQEECLLSYPALFLWKKVWLELSFVNFSFTI